jgi:allantoate deiminase
MREVAERRDLDIDWQVTSQHDACRANPELLDALKRAARDMAIPSIEMVSGAAHDAQQMSRIAPVGNGVRSQQGRPQPYA